MKGRPKFLDHVRQPVNSMPLSYSECGPGVWARQVPRPGTEDFKPSFREEKAVKTLIRLLTFAILLSGCAPGTTFPMLIPTPLPPDEDCSNFSERALDLSRMDDLFMSISGNKIIFDEDGAREHGFSEKSISLAREAAALSEAWLNVRSGDDPPVVTPHVLWLYDCATEHHGKKG